MIKWKTLQNGKNKVKRIHDGDGMIKTLGSVIFEIKSFLKVGSGRISRVTASTPAQIFPLTGQLQLNDPCASSKTSERDEPMDVVDLTEEEHETANERSDPGMRNKFHQNLDGI